MLTLNKREILLLKILGGLVGLLLVYYIILSPLLFNTEDTVSTISPQTQLKKLDSYYATYREMKAKNRVYQNKLTNTRKSITTIVNEHTTRVGLDNNKTRLKSNPGKVQDKYERTITEVVFEKVSMSPIIKLIYELENSNEALIKLGELDIRPVRKGSQTFDVKIKFESLKQK